MMRRFQHKVYQFLHSLWFSRLFVPLCVLSVLIFAAEGTAWNPETQYFLRSADLFIFFVFVLEFVVRIYAAKSKWEALGDPFMTIDALVLAGYACDLWGVAPWCSWLVVFRILKIFSIFRYIPLTERFFLSFKNYQEEFELFILSFLSVMSMGALGIYRLEHATNSQFSTLGDSFWWAIVTMSTVGYGDMVPITRGGKVLSALVMVFGLATMAMLTGMITKVFIDHFFGKRKTQCAICSYPHHDVDAKHCKNCGGEL